MSADDARARFAEATSTHLAAPLVPGVEIRHVDPATWRAAHDELWREADRGSPVSPGAIIPAEQRAMSDDLDAVLGHGLEHHLLFVAGDEVVGVFWGQQQAMSQYYMVSTAFRPSWQGRGLYKAFLPRIVAAARDAGFGQVWSRHRANNNPVLVPKLKAGFTIAGFEVSPRWGLLVHLRYYLREAMAQVHRYRIDGTGAAELRAAGLEIP